MLKINYDHKLTASQSNTQMQALLESASLRLDNEMKGISSCGKNPCIAPVIAHFLTKQQASFVIPPAQI